MENLAFSHQMRRSTERQTECATELTNQEFGLAIQSVGGSDLVCIVHIAAMMILES